MLSNKAVYLLFLANVLYINCLPPQLGDLNQQVAGHSFAPLEEPDFEFPTASATKPIYQVDNAPATDSELREKAADIVLDAAQDDLKLLVRKVYQNLQLSRQLSHNIAQNLHSQSSSEHSGHSDHLVTSGHASTISNTHNVLQNQQATHSSAAESSASGVLYSQGSNVNAVQNHNQVTLNNANTVVTEDAAEGSHLQGTEYHRGDIYQENDKTLTQQHTEQSHATQETHQYNSDKHNLYGSQSHVNLNNRYNTIGQNDQLYVQPTSHLVTGEHGTTISNTHNVLQNQEAIHSSAAETSASGVLYSQESNLNSVQNHNQALYNNVNTAVKEDLVEGSHLQGTEYHSTLGVSTGHLGQYATQEGHIYQENDETSSQQHAQQIHEAHQYNSDKHNLYGSQNQVNLNNRYHVLGRYADHATANSAKNAKYHYAYLVDDGIEGSFQEKNEKRVDGKVVGSFKYDDGHIYRTVFYEADENGFRIISDEILPSAKAKVSTTGVANVKLYRDGETRQYKFDKTGHGYEY